MRIAEYKCDPYVRISKQEGGGIFSFLVEFHFKLAHIFYLLSFSSLLNAVLPKNV